MNALRERIEDVKEELTTYTDRIEYRQGYIAAIRDLLEFNVEESE